ncbi:hypothetical protein DFA_07883 [Cavenderia fasciculata]|uniref:Ankyrin repeat-containing protein n=1 Tax=Cavenderia fasciculata TaxID=261658 RepID=F4Q3T6_CACFS|nr:uncharacterized protein DFA_07883 [Cavenderia fasciculata]EGG16902.1 hypothetical protein DFA_07883 [Cavenderia fasciculata]|eukprot:XP_004355376.1 hypothetical protein DFA_07883 [Cavenderia fasciculata]
MLHNRYTPDLNTSAKAAIDNATRIGHYEIVEFLLANQYHGHDAVTVEIAASVCGSGKVEAVKFLDQFRQQYLNKMDPSYYPLFTTHEFICAISKGQSLDVVKYLHANRTEKLKDGYQLMNNACKDDSLLEILKAAELGQLETIKFLLVHYPELKVDIAFDFATRFLKNDVVKFLYLNTTDNATIALTMAITHNNLEIAKYLLENHTDKVQLQSAQWEKLNLIQSQEWDHVKILFQSLYNKQ